MLQGLRTGDERIELPLKVLETSVIPFDQSLYLNIISNIEKGRNRNYVLFNVPSKLHTNRFVFCNPHRKTHLDSASLHLDGFAANLRQIKFRFIRSAKSDFIVLVFLSLLTRLSPRPISNSQLHMLPMLHLCPIYLVVFKGSYSLKEGYLILGGFTLRCLQRLSLPDLATLPLPLVDNRYTSGPSIPVLSY